MVSSGKNNPFTPGLALVFVLRLLFFYFLFYSIGYAASDYITQFEKGAINWRTGRITAVGNAVPRDNREASLEAVPGLARADANHQIIDVLQQVKINHGLLVGEYASKNDVILAGMEKTAWDAVVTKQYYTSALSVEIHIETSMYGGFLQLVLPENIRQIPKITRQSVPKQSVSADENPFTGLIVDAKGLDVEPVLNPEIVSEQGQDVYSPVFISREFAVQNGVCKYVTSMENAIKNTRVGDHPFIVKGLRTQGKKNSMIVINMSDYQKLEQQPERHTFLKECRVTIVIDSTHPD